jgi:hypothetical protein
MTVEQKKNLLRARIALALYYETGKVPTEEEIDHHYLVAGAKLGMRPEYCRGQLAKPVDAHTRPSCHNGGKL